MQVQTILWSQMTSQDSVTFQVTAYHMIIYQNNMDNNVAILPTTSIEVAETAGGMDLPYKSVYGSFTLQVRWELNS
jgi:hypothetical protein